MKHAFIALSLCLFAAPTYAADAPKHGARILFLTYSGTFRHGSVNRKEQPLAPAEIAMTKLGVESNLFRVDCTQEPATALKKENLDNYDIVMFYTTGPRAKWEVSDDDLNYFLKDWLKKKGHGFIGAHSAADTLGDFEPYWDMIGGTFDGHPWGAGGAPVTIVVHDEEHPVSRPWGKEFVIQDEIYQFKNWQPEKVRVLMSLDMSKAIPKVDHHVPIAWVKEYGDGRVMHMSLGHREEVWENPQYLSSMLLGVRWIMGLEEGNSTPNPELSSAEAAKASSVYAASPESERWKPKPKPAPKAPAAKAAAN